MHYKFRQGQGDRCPEPVLGEGLVEEEWGHISEVWGVYYIVRHARNLARAALAEARGRPLTWSCAIGEITIDEESLAVRDNEPFRTSVKGLRDILRQHALNRTGIRERNEL